MDLSFFRRGQSLLDRRQPAALDHGVLLATLSALQSTSPTARAAIACSPRGKSAGGDAPLVEILVGGAGWREAVAAQGGCFHRAGAPSVKPL